MNLPLKGTREVRCTSLDLEHVRALNKGLLLLNRRCEMEKVSESNNLVDDKILKTNAEIEQEKEQKFVNLIIEIIVSSTLKEYYEKGD